MSTYCVTGIFYHYKLAHRLVRKLERRGYPREQLNLLLPAGRRTPRPERAKTDKEVSLEHASEGFGIGSVFGGIAGAALAAVAALGTSVAWPDAGLMVPGPLLAALAGLGVGGMAGGLFGGLVGAIIPDHPKRRMRSTNSRRGAVLVGVPTQNSAESEQVKSWMREQQAEQIYVGRGVLTVSAAAKRFLTRQTMTFPTNERTEEKPTLFGSAQIVALVCPPSRSERGSGQVYRHRFVVTLRHEPPASRPFLAVALRPRNCASVETFTPHDEKSSSGFLSFGNGNL